MVIFIGDKPSSKNKNSNVAFVGTKSYRILLNWLSTLDVSINETYVFNSTQFKKINNFISLQDDLLYLDTNLHVDKFIALGLNASKKLEELGIPHFKAPHPSGLNRKLNDKQFVKTMLKNMKQYIHESV